MASSEPVWIDLAVAIAVYERQLAEHGGGAGIRDLGALKSALARPLNRWSYGDEDLSDLAAAYAFAVARNRPFVDGNKRSAFVLSLLFLARNGVQVDIPGDEAREAFLALSAGALSEDELAEWFRQRLAAS
ncbi:type II toxin-antitoxin system death-on-curing family toxin [Croceibacterium aestuarii]|uniref:type II toxin-antitoxin system death-on-curing family toxin n=1 Tax=Croceibacterium aestuarii TaxID=3064139 RepID=UPI00272EA8A6|nr:type II toxin-antitoxin system death-on-curing family toxin [Croceibacterium sp. D39]